MLISVCISLQLLYLIRILWFSYLFYLGGGRQLHLLLLLLNYIWFVLLGLISFVDWWKGGTLRHFLLIHKFWHRQLKFINKLFILYFLICLFLHNIVFHLRKIIIINRIDSHFSNFVHLIIILSILKLILNFDLSNSVFILLVNLIERLIWR